MTTASQDTGAAAARVTTNSPAGHSAIFKFSGAAAFALMLALAPAPAFAQHGGGGGGGGGAHGGGGGGGGSHGGGGGGGHAGGGSGGGGSHAGASSAASAAGSHGGGASNSNGGGHWWNPFHSGASGSGSGASASTNSGTNANTEHFAAGNNTWQEPPTGHPSAAVNHYAPASGTRPVVVGNQPTNGAIRSIHGAGAVAAPPHVFPPHRGGYPNYFYYPYPYFGFGYGGGLWWGGFYPCDPFWGCYGYGYGYDGGYGFYGGSFGGDYSADLSYDSANGEGSSQEPNPTLFAAPAGEGEQGAGETSQQPYVILYLKDGSSYAVSDYWLAGGKLHYVTSYGGENVIDESQLDLQRTVNENAARGVDFTLRPEPAGNGEAAPAAPGPEARPPAPQP